MSAEAVAHNLGKRVIKVGLLNPKEIRPARPIEKSEDTPQAKPVNELTNGDPPQLMLWGSE